jgi:hypothetical protein
MALFAAGEQGGKVRWVGVVMVTVHPTLLLLLELELGPRWDLGCVMALALLVACHDEEPDALSRLMRRWSRREGVSVAITNVWSRWMLSSDCSCEIRRLVQGICVYNIDSESSDY